MSDESSSTADPWFQRREMIGRAAESSVYVVLVGALTLFATSLMTFVWAFAKLLSFGDLLLDDGADSSLAIVELLEVIDTVLLATVLLITAIGLIELFITPLRLPAWLDIRDLTALKSKLIDVILLVAAIKALEKLVVSKEPLDALWYALAVAVVILALLAAKVVNVSVRKAKPDAPKSP